MKNLNPLYEMYELEEGTGAIRKGLGILALGGTLLGGGGKVAHNYMNTTAAREAALQSVQNMKGAYAAKEGGRAWSYLNPLSWGKRAPINVTRITNGDQAVAALQGGGKVRFSGSPRVTRTVVNKLANPDGSSVVNTTMKYLQ